MELHDYIIQICEKAKDARFETARLTEEQKNALLAAAADLLVRRAADILSANEEDMKRAVEKGMSDALQDRLRLTDARIHQMAEGLLEVAKLPDPVGVTLDSFERPNGMRLKKISVPMGVIGIIFESRPNVTADAFALCFKAGSCAILKGGSDALSSNRAIVDVLHEALRAAGITESALQLIDVTDREATRIFMQQREYVDLLIPRGGAGLIRSVVENSRIPVIETGVGNCHIYVDKAADPAKVLPIIINAKTQRIGVCNAAESLVIHEAVAEEYLPKIAEALREAVPEHPVELRADEASLPLLTGSDLPEAEFTSSSGRIQRILPASLDDFGKEYLDYIMSVKIVGDVREAIDHINRYHTGHSDCIITEDPAAASLFLKEIDSACVYHNVSTRFTDGFEFGFGAEIGISTQKLHARGPMGLREIMSYKYTIEGDGQIRG